MPKIYETKQYLEDCPTCDGTGKGPMSPRDNFSGTVYAFQQLTKLMYCQNCTSGKIMRRTQREVSNMGWLRYLLGLWRFDFKKGLLE